MYLTEDGIIGFVKKNNGIVITRPIIKTPNYKTEHIFAAITGYETIISHFFTKILDNLLARKVTLLIVETDKVIIKKEWLDHEKIKNVYTWNKPFEHEKLKFLPIGLNLRRQLLSITKFVNGGKATNKNKLLCFNCDLETNPERKILNDLVASWDFCDRLKFLKPNESYFFNSKIEGNILIRVTNPKCYEQWINYKFILSPPGAGIDCHRTYEAVICGIIPIVKSSILDPMYEDLPILIVKEWNNINPLFLEEKFEQITNNKKLNKYNMEKINLKYWIEKFLK